MVYVAFCDGNCYISSTTGIPCPFMSVLTIQCRHGLQVERWFQLTSAEKGLCEFDEYGFSANSSNSHTNIASESEGVSLVDIVIN
jgi:hypothetical protein